MIGGGGEGCFAGQEIDHRRTTEKGTPFWAREGHFLVSIFHNIVILWALKSVFTSK